MAYDGTGRRVSQTVTGQGTSGNMAMHSYSSDGHQLLEERNGSGQTLKQHVWGSRYVDELVQTGINTDPADGGEQNAEAFYTVLQDANFNVTGIVNTSGALVERYDYDAYGERTVYTSGATNDPGLYAMSDQSARVAVGGVEQAYGLMDFAHQGLLHDNPTGLVYNRARYLSTELDRFMSQDPLGYVDGLNWYQGYGSNSVNWLDPAGNAKIVFLFEGFNGYSEKAWEQWRKGEKITAGDATLLKGFAANFKRLDTAAPEDLNNDRDGTYVAYFSEFGAASALATFTRYSSDQHFDTKTPKKCMYHTIAVLGHSFGGDTAWDFASQLHEQLNVEINLGMTFDPRPSGDRLLGEDVNKSTWKPGGVGRAVIVPEVWYNFYRPKGLLHGNELPLVPNLRNIPVQGEDH